MEYSTLKNVLFNLNEIVRENEIFKIKKEEYLKKISDLQTDVNGKSSECEIFKIEIKNLKDKNKKLKNKNGCKENDVYTYVVDVLKYYNRPIYLNEIYDVIMYLIMVNPDWKYKSSSKIEGQDLKKQIESVLSSYTEKGKFKKSGNYGKYLYTLIN